MKTNSFPLVESDVSQKFGISEFKRKTPIHYNLDVIISVGYRVKSLQDTQSHSNTSVPSPTIG